MPRAAEYLNTFMAGLAYPSMYAQIRGDIDTLEREREYIDGLIAQEQQQLALAEQQFATPPQDLSTLKILLTDFQQNQANLRRLGGDVEAVRRIAGGELTTEQQAVVTSAMAGEGAIDAQADSLEALVATLNAAGKATVLAQIEANETNRSPGDLDILRRAAARPTPVPTAGTEGLGAEERRLLLERDRLQQAITAMYDAGPEGIRGGERGRAEVARRGQEGDQLLREYLTALEDDGQATLEDFAGDADRLAEAADLYREAKNFGAYRNDQQKFFEQSFLDSKARLATLREQADRMARPAGMTRQDEIARRYWEARGYDFDKPYLAQQKEWYYQNLVRGDQMYEAGLEASRRLFEEDPDRFVVPQGYVVMLTPDNEAQTLARDYVAQRFASGERTLSMGEARRELRKVLKGDDLDEALAFAHAYNRGLNQNVQTPDDAEREMEQMRAARAEQDEMRRAAREAQRRVEDAEALEARMEAEQAGAVRRARGEVSRAPEAAQTLYNTLRVRGMERDEINNALNQGFEILVNPSITDETRKDLLGDLGFSQADQARLAVAYGPQIRERVRQADPLTVMAYSNVPSLAAYIDRDTVRAAQQRVTAQQERLVGDVERMRLGLPQIPPEAREPLPAFERQRVSAPGELPAGMPPVEPEAYMLERARRSPDYLEQEALRRQSPTPGIPARQSEGPFLTAAQRAVFQEMDDDTLRVLSGRSTYAAQELAQRERERIDRSPIELTRQLTADIDPRRVQEVLQEAREQQQAADQEAPETTTTSTPVEQPAPEPAPAGGGGGQVQTTGNLLTRYNEIIADPNMDLAEKTRRLNAIRNEMQRRGTDMSRLPPIPSATAPAPAEQQEADPFARRPGESDAEYFARLEAMD